MCNFVYSHCCCVITLVLDYYHLVQTSSKTRFFYSSDDQLEDSDSDEHSRSESMTGMTS